MEFREAKKEDSEEIRKLIQELAEFEKMPDGPKISHKDIEKDGFKTDPPLFKIFVAADNGKIVGYAMYYHTYSSWEGKSMFLEDLYVTPEYRNKHIGSKLFDMVAKKAAEDNFSRLDFSVLNWNPAQELYKRKGAVDLTVTESWHHYRLSGETLKKYGAQCQ